MEYLNDFFGKVSSVDVRRVVSDIFKNIKKNDGNFSYFKTYTMNNYPHEFDNEIEVLVEVYKDENEFNIDADSGDTEPNMMFIIYYNGGEEPRIFNQMYFELIEAVRHELEHISQYDAEANHSSDYKSRYDYFTSMDEVPAFVSGMYYRAKKEKTHLNTLFENYLSNYLEDNMITYEEYENILDLWIQYANFRFPRAKFFYK